MAEPADAEPALAAAAPETEGVNFWKDALPANDAIDKQILKLFIPAMLNFLIAIVNDTWAKIVDNDKMNRIKRREDIVYQSMYMA